MAEWTQENLETEAKKLFNENNRRQIQAHVKETGSKDRTAEQKAKMMQILGTGFVLDAERMLHRPFRATRRLWFRSLFLTIGSLGLGVLFFKLGYDTNSEPFGMESAVYYGVSATAVTSSTVSLCSRTVSRKYGNKLLADGQAIARTMLSTKVEETDEPTNISAAAEPVEGSKVLESTVSEKEPVSAPVAEDPALNKEVKKKTKSSGNPVPPSRVKEIMAEVRAGKEITDPDELAAVFAFAQKLKGSKHIPAHLKVQFEDALGTHKEQSVPFYTPNKQLQQTCVRVHGQIQEQFGLSAEKTADVMKALVGSPVTKMDLNASLMGKASFSKAPKIVAVWMEALEQDEFDSGLFN